MTRLVITTYHPCIFCSTAHERYISISDITKTVVFLLKNDPNYYGFVTNTVFEAQDGTTILDYTVNWTPYKKETEGPDMANSIRNAVLHAKCIAEA
mmetsp:Transcript_8052/g.11061  ORF Transcript_8052/g.11061 Transcript_8052/m.11061 type:complete len:96 (+) Transcript_8052:469-756(+)